MDAGTVYDVIIIVIAFVGLSVMMLVKNLLDKKTAAKEKEEVKKEVEAKLKALKEEPQDVLTMMRRSVAELVGYYTMNKQQARSAFSSALFVCFLGFILFAVGVIITYFAPGKKSVIAYSTLAGAIVEVISGLFFWLYSQASKQINIFHDRLIETQQFLTAIQIVNNISKSKRDGVYAYIVQHLVGGKKAVNLKKTQGNNSGDQSGKKYEEIVE